MQRFSCHIRTMSPCICMGITYFTTCSAPPRVYGTFSLGGLSFAPIQQKSRPRKWAGFAKRWSRASTGPLRSALSFCLRDRRIRALHLRPPLSGFSRAQESLSPHSAANIRRKPMRGSRTVPAFPMRLFDILLTYSFSSITSRQIRNFLYRFPLYTSL